MNRSPFLFVLEACNYGAVDAIIILLDDIEQGRSWGTKEEFVKAKYRKIRSRNYIVCAAYHRLVMSIGGPLERK